MEEDNRILYVAEEAIINLLLHYDANSVNIMKSMLDLIAEEHRDYNSIMEKAAEGGHIDIVK